MGNFSRDTYKPAQSYAAVRLQQGVPLVDADWNEQADIARNELYGGLAVCAGTAAVRGGGLQVAGTGTPNDLVVGPGQAVIAGRPVSIATPRTYTTQRYRDATPAQTDNVVRPPDLTTPAAPRTDIVYLDMFEREVNSGEDPFLVNPAIGIETSVRTKREIVLRVAEGTATLPAPAPGHQLLPLALLRRTAGAAVIDTTTIQDIKPYGYGGTRRLAVAPAFVFMNAGSPTSPYAAWSIVALYFTSKVRAVKPPGAMDAWGVVPLSLPDGANLRRLRIRGRRSSSLLFSIDRDPHDPAGSSEKLLDANLPAMAIAPFDVDLAIAQDGRQIVNNATHAYVAHAWAQGQNLEAEIHGISITYDQ
jgi:hypothetical protein